MNAIRDVTGDEAKMIALQFLGQNLGEMKELDRNIVSGLKHVSASIDPHAMLGSIAQPAAAPQPIQAPQHVQQHAVQQPELQPVVLQPVLQQIEDTDQLELNFNSSPYSASIFSKLESLNDKLNKLIEINAMLLASFDDTKKKDTQKHNK